MFRTWGCETTFAMIEVAKSWAAQFTPEGFEPLTFFPARALVPQAPNRTVKASFLIASNHCEEVDLGADHGAAETVTDVNELYYGVFVDPPDEFEDGQKMYVYPFQWVLDDPKVHSVLSAWGIQASPGSVSLAVNAEAGPARSWTVNAQNGNLTAQLDVQTRGAVSAGTGTTTFRIFAAPSDGVVAYAMDYTIEVANSTQNPQGLGSGTALFQISGPGSPAEAPLPSPIGFTRWTPADKVAQRGRLVTL